MSKDGTKIIIEKKNMEILVLRIICGSIYISCERGVQQSSSLTFFEKLFWKK